MQIVDPSSPWWPLAVAQMLGLNRAPGTYAVRFHQWLYWRFHFEIKGEGFVPCPPQPNDTTPEMT